MFKLISYKSKFALLFVGAFIGAAFCVYALNTPPAPINLNPILYPLVYIGLALNLVVAVLAMLFSLILLVFDIVTFCIDYRHNW